MLLDKWLNVSIEDNEQEIDLQKPGTQSTDPNEALNEGIDGAVAKKEGTVKAVEEPASTDVDETKTLKPDDHLEVEVSQEDESTGNTDPESAVASQGDGPKVEGEIKPGDQEVETGEETTVKDGEVNGDVDPDAEPEVKEAAAAMEHFKSIRSAIESYQTILAATQDTKVVTAIKAAVEEFDVNFTCDQVIPSLENFEDSDRSARALQVANEGLSRVHETLTKSINNIEEFLALRK